jgi:O-antigen/teichoic acid export membrane protein
VTAPTVPLRTRAGAASAAYGRARRSPFMHSMVETLGARVVALALGFVSSIVITRSLGPDGRGLLALAAATSTLGVYFLTAGLHSANTYFVARDRSLLGPLLGNSLVCGLGLGAVGGLGTVGILLLVSGSSLPHPLALVVAASIPVGITFAYLQQLLLGVDQVRTYNFNEIANRAGALVLLLVFLAISGGLSALSVFMVTTCGTALCLFAGYHRLAQLSDGRPRPQFPLLRTTFHYGFRTYVAALFAFLIQRADIFVVRATLGQLETGIYAVAASAAELLYILPAAAGALLFPKLAGIADRHEQWRVTRRAAAGIGLVVTVAGLLLAMLSRPAVTILYGADFADAARPLALLCLAMVPFSVNSMLAAYLAAIGSPYATAGVWAVGALLNIVANVLLVPHHGLTAAAAVSVLTYSAVLVGNYGLVRRSLRCE